MFVVLTSHKVKISLGFFRFIRIRLPDYILDSVGGTDTGGVDQSPTGRELTALSCWAHGASLVHEWVSVHSVPLFFSLLIRNLLCRITFG